jgi:hypothetical protein
MFENSINLPGSMPAVSVIDTDNGRTVRRANAGSGIFWELVNSHQESNENKGAITDRFLVQPALIFIDSVSAKPMRASVSIVSAYPRSPEVNHGTMTELLRAAFAFFIGDLTAGQLTTLSDQAARVFAGET